MLIDQFNRKHTYLRISLTDKCNLRCFYCMPEEKYDFAPNEKLMQPHEIETIAKKFIELGVTKIRLTGGEPLVRKDSGKIIELLSKLPVKLSMTTNAIRIDKHIEIIKNANFSALNVSLDTLKEDRFFSITRRKDFFKVKENINLLLQNNIPLKINVVLMKGINDDEILDFIELTKFQPIEIRFIEFMPFTGNQWNSEKVVTLKEILDKVGSAYAFNPLPIAENDTAKRYSIENHRGSFAIISTMTEPFCSSCNRMRLTADGKMKNCLFSNSEVDLLSELRKKGDIKSLIQFSIYEKAEKLGGQFSGNFTNIQPDKIDNRTMITIGG